MKIVFIKKYRIPLLLIGVATLLLFFSFAIPMKRTYRGKEPVVKQAVKTIKGESYKEEYRLLRTRKSTRQRFRLNEIYINMSLIIIAVDNNQSNGESLFTKIKDNLIEYAQTIAKETPCYVMIHPVDEQSPMGLRDYLKKYYGETGALPEEGDIVIDPAGIVEILYPLKKLKGSIFIGDVPVYLYLSRETFPCDLYFMDLDGTWEEFSSNLGVCTKHTGNINPEIWVSRIRGNADTIKTFIQKVLDFRNEIKNGTYQFGNACLYADWLYAHTMTPGIYYLLHPNVVYEDRYYSSQIKLMLGISETASSADFFKDYIFGKNSKPVFNFNWIDISAGGNAAAMKFKEKGGPDGELTYNTLKDKTGPNFLILRGPGFGNFLVEDYIGGVTFHNNSNIISTIASTKSTIDGIIQSEVSYEPLYYTASKTDKTLGDAFFTLINTAITYLQDEDSSSGLGYVFLGDPTIKMSSVLPLGAPDYVKDYVSKGICGGIFDIEPTDIIWKIVKNKYYEDEIQIGFEVDIKMANAQKKGITIDDNGFINFKEVKKITKAVPIDYEFKIGLAYGSVIGKAKGTIKPPFNLHNVFWTPLKLPFEAQVNYISLEFKGLDLNKDNNSIGQAIDCNYSLDLFVQDMEFRTGDEFYKDGHVWKNARNEFRIKIENRGILSDEQLEQVQEKNFIPLQLAIYNSSWQEVGQVTHQLNTKYSVFKQKADGGNGGYLLKLTPYQMLDESPLGFPLLKDYPKNTKFAFQVTIDPDKELPDDFYGNNDTASELELPY